jgi:hypothetical protein
MEVILHKLKIHNGFFFLSFFSFFFSFHLGGCMKGRVVDLVARWDWQQRGATNPRKQNPGCKEPMKLDSKRGGKRWGLGEDRYEDVPNMVPEIWSSNKNLIIIIFLQVIQNKILIMFMIQLITVEHFPVKTTTPSCLSLDIEGYETFVVAILHLQVK